MKKLVVSIFILTLILLPAVLADSQDAMQSKPYLNPVTKIMVRRVIADTIDKQVIDSLKEKGCLVRHSLKDSTSLECPDDIVPELNVKVSRIFHITDISADQQIGADKVWAAGIDGTGVKVAILDTGIDMDNPELKDSYLGGYNFVSNSSIPEDDSGHGTHVAGIITSNGIDANSKGVAPGAGIYVYKVCNSNGECYEDDVLAGIEAAVSSGAKVMSMSMGGGNITADNCDSETLPAKVNWAVSQGVTAVVTAGNDGSGVASPGCASGAIAVGAVDSSNNVPSWSGKGKALDIVAPGVDIYSTLIGGYGSMTGTSMATPHVTGVVALLLQANSTLTTSMIKTILYSTASPVNKCYSGSSEVTCTPEMTGAGVVNAYKAYLYVKPPSLVSYWKLDENSGTTAFDSTPNKNDGTINGATWTSGKSWSALQFDGINDYVRVKDSNSLDMTNAITISAWIYPTSWSSTYPRIVSKEASASAAPYALELDNSSKRALFCLNACAGENCVDSGSNSISLNNWYYVAGTWNGTHSQIYVNGALKNSKSLSGTMTATTNDILIGNNPSNNRQFNGTIDEVKIYNYALNESEIKAGYGIQTCSDGTPYGSCSLTKPKYCSSGTLINKCSSCGCPSGQSCNATTQACVPCSCGSTWTLSECDSSNYPCTICIYTRKCSPSSCDVQFRRVKNCQIFR
jgi:subtilisin family serine protease